MDTGRMRLQYENNYLKKVLSQMMNDASVSGNHIVTKMDTFEKKVSLFTSLFRGRSDAYAVRWESNNHKSGYTPACAIEWEKPLCQKPKIKCSNCQHRNLLPLTNHVLQEHLTGEKTIGLYPLLTDNTCFFLAIDFDKYEWQRDVLAFVKTCRKFDVPYAIEKSRSGDGAHVWIFFYSNVPATLARHLGRFLLDQSKDDMPNYTLKSYDRMLPNQDVLPNGGLGNLIALPLQREPAKAGNSLFINDQFIPYPDQWIFLSTIRKISEQDIKNILAINDHLVLTRTPNNLTIEIKNGLHISKEELPPFLITEIMDIATFGNPNYYRAKHNRMQTNSIPKKIKCAFEQENKLILPRGCLEDVLALFKKYNISTDVVNHCNPGESIHVKFHGNLTFHQEEAVENLLANNFGTLVATTGFGKTVVGAAMIAERKVNTLVIVHRKHLMQQWVEKLSAFLNIPPNEIGQIGGGKNNITGKVDVATIQSLNAKGQLKSCTTIYGQVIIDECHGVPAITFENVIKQIRPNYVLGLTATPKRKDGMHPIITMQCGPICYTIDAKTMAKIRPFTHRLIKKETNFQTFQTEVNDIYNKIANDRQRNKQVFNDILIALENGRSPLILTERIAHLELLKDMLMGSTKNLIVLSGNMKAKDQQEEFKRLAQIPPDEERVILATGKYIGEGFDDARLDTLFLTMPIAWKGTLQQYVGRLHRQYDGKQEVQVYDYIDSKVPRLKNMNNKRLAGYKSMGYMMNHENSTSEQMLLF